MMIYKKVLFWILLIVFDLCLASFLFSQNKHSNMILEKRDCLKCHDKNDKQKLVSINPSEYSYYKSQKNKIDHQNRLVGRNNASYPLTKSMNNSWEPLTTLEGGKVGKLLMHPIENIIYAFVPGSDYTQIYSSDNGAEQWSYVGSFPDNFNDATIDPNNPSVFYAAKDSCIYKSTDSGQTWAKSQMTSNSFWTSNIHVCPSNSDIIYVGGTFMSNDCWAMAICKSMDGGISWNLNFGSPFVSNEYCETEYFKVDPKEPNIFYIGGFDYMMNSAALFKSKDGGINWKRVNIGFGDIIWSISIDPDSTNKIYFGTSGGVYKSNSGGTNCIRSNIRFSSYQLEINPQNTNVIYSAARDVIYKSDDGGIFWRSYSMGSDQVCYSLLIDPNSPENIYWGSPVGVFKSSNGGKDWATKNSGFYSSSITCIGISPSEPNIIYAEYDNLAVFKSTDFGDNWLRLPNFLACGNVSVITIDPSSSDIAYALQRNAAT